MTIFLCDRIDRSELAYTFTTANDPDIIGVEVGLDGNVLIDVTMDQRGQISVVFDQDGGQMEFELLDLRQVLDKCEHELIVWREQMIAPGGPWEGVQ